MSIKKYSREATKPTKYLSDAISITGLSAVGTSSALEGLRAVQPTLYRHISAGEIARECATRLGMTIEQFSAHKKAHQEEGWDKKIDTAMGLYGLQNHVVIEGRLAHVTSPYSYHVRIVAPPRVRAQRRQGHPAYVEYSLEKVKALLLERDRNDSETFRNLYPGCLWSSKKYDLVLCSDTYGVPNIVKLIIEGHAAWRTRLDAEGRIEYGITI